MSKILFDPLILKRTEKLSKISPRFINGRNDWAESLLTKEWLRRLELQRQELDFGELARIIHQVKIYVSYN